jgi:C-terminal processing protease CtpA/Prc
MASGASGAEFWRSTMNTMASITGSAGLALLLMTAGAQGLAAESAKAEPKAEPKAAKSDVELEQELAAARKRLDAAAREVAEISMKMSDHVMPQTMTFFGPHMQRAMLGINLGSSRDEVADGVAIASVSPGGPAEDAGLKAGDVITELNGKALKRDGEDSAREKLLKGMRDVKPGEKVALTYRRDGKVAKVNVVAEPLGDRVFTRAVPAPGMHGMVNFMPNMAFMRAEGVFGSAELVPLTPKLGQYFGTEEGLLVVRAPMDSRLKLEDGDVIVDIDGRTPSNPAHALRILSSYQAGEKLKLNVLRTKKRMTFDITIPESTWEEPVGGRRFFFRDRGVPAIPAVPGPGISIRGPAFSGEAVEIAVPVPEIAPLPPTPPDDPA